MGVKSSSTKRNHATDDKLNVSKVEKNSFKKFNYNIKLPSKYCNTTAHLTNKDTDVFEYENKKWLNTVSPGKNISESDIDNLTTISSSITDSKYTFSGLVQYVAYCWIDEKGIVLRPDMFHHAICCEISRHIITYSAKFRMLFTENSEKEDLEVVANDDTDFINKIDSRLDKKVTNKEFKKLFTETHFKSQPDNYETVKRISFSNAATPYFNYIRSKCGLPSIGIIDDIDDWIILKNFISEMKNIIVLIDSFLEIYLTKCESHIDDIITNFTSAYKLSNKLREIFYINDSKICASGHVEKYFVNGWLKDFYIENPAFLSLYQSHLPYLPFKQSWDNKKYCLITGLLSSVVEDNTIVPTYGNIKMQINDDELFNKLKN